ncbi:MAG: DUF2314 domain-containing protein [Verrucomicrobiae bacterium]|nr:DUF2314 domain-containing protein [Verrucomicrobiae bacterium]
MKRTAQIAPLMIAVLAVWISGCTHRDKGFVEDSDPEMVSAIAKAQETLPEFWQTFDHRTHGESNFTLIVRITDHGRVEHFNITTFEPHHGSTIVTLSQVPKIVTNVKLGDRIEIPTADITDWSYMRDGKYAGLWTMPPRFKYMPPEQVEAFKQAMVAP